MNPQVSEQRHLSNGITSGFDCIIGIRNADGGWPAVCPGDTSGYWTTASAIKTILKIEGKNKLPFLRPSIRFLLQGQNADGGWGLIQEGESSVLTTSDCIIALQKAKDFLDTGGVKDTIRAIHGAVDWLSMAQNNDGGWGIEKGSRSRVIATYHGVSALLSVPSEARIKKSIDRSIDWLLKIRNTKEDSWPFFEGGHKSIASTALAIQTLIEYRNSFGKKNVEETITKGIDFIISQQSDHLPWNVESEGITRQSGLLRLDYFTLFEVGKALIQFERKNLDRLILCIRWILDNQNPDGSWNLTDTINCKKMDPSVWTTIDTVDLLSSFKTFVGLHLDEMINQFCSDLRQVSEDEGRDRSQLAESLRAKIDLKQTVVIRDTPKNWFISRQLGTLLMAVYLALCLSLISLSFLLYTLEMLPLQALKCSLIVILYVYFACLFIYGRKGGITVLKKMKPSEFYAILVSFFIGLPTVVQFLFP